MQQHAPSWPSTVHRVNLTNLWRRTNATKIWRERVSGCDQLATATRVSLVSHHFSHTPRNYVASYQKSTSQFSQGKTYQQLQYADILQMCWLFGSGIIITCSHTRHVFQVSSLFSVCMSPSVLSTSAVNASNSFALLQLESKSWCWF